MKNEEGLETLEPSKTEEKVEIKTSTKQEDVKLEYKYTKLHSFAKKGLTKDILLLIKYHNISHLLNDQDVDGNTALHLAIQGGHQETVLKLLTLGAQQDIKNHKNQSIIDIALIYGHLEIAELLYTQHYALRPSLPNVLFDMITEAVSRYQKLHIEDTRTSGKRNEGIFQCLDWLLSLEISFNITDSDGNTLIHYAVLKSHDFDKFTKPVVEELVKLGLDVKVKNNQDETPCNIAVNQIKFVTAQMEQSQKNLTTTFFAGLSNSRRTPEKIISERISELEDLRSKVKDVEDFFDSMIRMIELGIFAKK